jgi:hypothetical protein
MTPSRILGACLLLALGAAATLLHAQAPVIYRCTDASGAVSIQNDTPCPAGSRQEIRRVEALPSMPPAPSIAPAETRLAPPPQADFVQVAGPADERIAAPERPDLPRAARIADDARLPPPPIFQCETWDNDSYVSEDPAPKPRCVRLDTAGVGQACETKYDRCARIGDKAACDGWKRRQREIESSWRHARGNERPALQEEFARVTRILTDSSCALPP